jgi:hypothetical protein
MPGQLLLGARLPCAAPQAPSPPPPVLRAGGGRAHRFHTSTRPLPWRTTCMRHVLSSSRLVRCSSASFAWRSLDSAAGSPERMPPCGRRRARRGGARRGAGARGAARRAGVSGMQGPARGARRPRGGERVWGSVPPLGAPHLNRLEPLHALAQREDEARRLRMQR